MLVVKYTPPASAAESETLDITDYVIRAVWSGDAEQAARKLELEVAYNSPEKDKAFQNLDLRLGGKIEALYQDDYGQQAHIFSGRVFYRKRATDTYSFGIVAYDNMIYLAKSKVHMVFNNATVTDAVKRVCNEIGISVNENNPLLNTVVSFIADGKSCTEVINILLEKARADTGLKYNALSIDGKIALVQAGTLVDDYIASDITDVVKSEHSESYTDMINRVKMVDEHGSLVQTLSAGAYIAEYGVLQEVYKMQPPKDGETVDNVKGAKAMLKYIENESQLEALGNIQCITGYAITVQEEQLTGKFLIVSDTHSFENNVHKMALTLEYMPETEETTEITYS